MATRAITQGQEEVLGMMAMLTLLVVANGSQMVLTIKA